MSSIVETVEPSTEAQVSATDRGSAAAAILDAFICLVLLVGPIVVLLAFA